MLINYLILLINFIYCNPKLNSMNKETIIKVVEFSSNDAEIYLRKHNLKNRKYSQKIIDKYAIQMKNGEWQENSGETIKLSETGVLLDGQHRLAAQAKSGVTLKWTICENIPDVAFEVIDTGKPRMAGDALHVLGVKNSNNVAVIIRGYLLFKANIFDAKIGKTPFTSHSKIVDLYNEDPEKWNSITTTTLDLYQRGKKILQPGFIGSWYAFLKDEEPEESILFFNKLCLGIGSFEFNDPIYVLRNIFIDQRSSEMKLTGSMKNAYLIVTWNSFLANKKYTKIPHIYGKSKFPILIKTKKEANKVQDDVKQ